MDSGEAVDYPVPNAFRRTEEEQEEGGEEIADSFDGAEGFRSGRIAIESYIIEQNAFLILLRPTWWLWRRSASVPTAEGWVEVKEE